jgi:hypothetical protein
MKAVKLKRHVLFLPHITETQGMQLHRQVVLYPNAYSCLQVTSISLKRLTTGRETRTILGFEETKFQLYLVAPFILRPYEGETCTFLKNKLSSVEFLRPAVSRPVRLGIVLPFGAHDRILSFSFLLTITLLFFL